MATAASQTHTNAGRERRKVPADQTAKLVAERAEMLVAFCKLAGLEPFTPEKNTEELLQDFCQILVDYVAAGHFALYERIIEGTERRREVAELATQLYPRIAKTTDMALDFNDKYDCEHHSNAIHTLAKDLSALGEELAVRAELEDRLIEVLRRR